jgi:hypothetical protein
LNNSSAQQSINQLSKAQSYKPQSIYQPYSYPNQFPTLYAQARQQGAPYISSTSGKFYK